jgi:hypothetical protein
VINKATPILSVTNSPIIFDGAPHAATVTASVAGSVSNILTGGAATQTAVGTYVVTADFTSSDPNYSDLTGASAGNLVISAKIVPTLSTTSGPFTYDGAPHAATVTASVAGTVSNVQYNGSATVPTNAGTYIVTADFLPTDTVTYETLIGASAGSITINKATPTLSITNSPVTFNGAPHAATVTGSVAGVASNILTGGAATQTAIGTYAVTADFAPTDSANYNPLTGASAGNFVISAGAAIFADVPDGAFAKSFIESVYFAGVTGGCTTSPLNYCPNLSVTRAQMAVFLLRAKHGNTYVPPAATGTMFGDVQAGDFAAAYIEAMANEGITGGCGNGNFCPNTAVTRAQMAVFLLRAKNGNTYVPPTATGTMFTDVPTSGFAAAYIEALATAAITGGCGGGNFCPDVEVTRAQMAVFLVKTFNLP